MDKNLMLDFIVDYKYLIEDIDLKELYPKVYRRAFTRQTGILTYDNEKYVSIGYYHMDKKPCLNVCKSIDENSTALLYWLSQINVSIEDFKKIQHNDFLLRNIYKSKSGDFSKGSSFHLHALICFIIEEETGTRQHDYKEVNAIIDSNKLTYPHSQFKFKVYNTEVQGFKNGKLKISRFADELIRLKDIQANL